MARYTWDFCARGLLALAADSGRRRVLSLITRLDVGGSSEIAILSAQGLRRMGCDVLLAAGPSPGSSAEPAVGCREIPALRRDVHPLKDAAAFVQILRLLRAWRPHILHTHSSKAGILGRWAAFLHNVFHRDGIRIVHTPHGHVFYGYFGPAKTAVFTMAERMSAAVSDRLVAISSGEMRESLERGVGEPSQWVVIHSGVKLEEPGLAVAEAKARLSGSFGVPPDAAVVGTVVRLEPVKGTDVLLKAAPEILAAFPQKRVAFLVIGDGPLREPLGRLSRDLGVSASVVFAGLQKDPAALMRAMDVYVQPSRNEGMGMALAQAQWLRLPAVASRVCGIPDVVQDGKTGILVPPDDPAALARAVGTLLRDADLRARLGAAGKKWVSRVDDTGYPAFSVEAMIERLDRLYQDL